MGAIAQGLSPNSSPTENAHLAGPVPVVSHFWPASRSAPATLPPYRRSLAAEKSNVHFAPAVQTHAAASSARRISLAFDLYANEIAAEMATVFFTVELIDDKHESTLRHQEV